MDFNALWLTQFYGGLAGEDSVRKEETASTMTVSGQNPNELLLTSEDCVFLFEVGIRSWKAPVPLEKIPKDSAQKHTFKRNSIFAR